MNNELKIYTDLSPLADGQLKNLNPLLSYHWKGLDKNSILSGDYNCNSPFRLTKRPQDAEFVVLPMHWSYYLWNGKAKMREATKLAEMADQCGRLVIVWYKGDLVPVIPFENNILFLPGIIKSEMKQNYRACPVFVEDPAPNFGASHAPYRVKRERPAVGFCGYGSSGALKMVWGLLRGLQKNFTGRFSRNDYLAVPILPPTIARARALRLLSDCPDVDTCFVIRDKYTERKFRNLSPAIEELSKVFFSNIYGSDYTLCLRGYGNWSYRFYETLACGRIPVFIDTDCVLPASSTIDWKKYCVWIDHLELESIGEKIVDFHSSMSAADFIELQKACRELWEEQLTIEGFMKHFHTYL